MNVFSSPASLTGLILVCALVLTAGAAELEGTPVPLDSTPSVQAASAVSAAPAANASPVAPDPAAAPDSPDSPLAPAADNPQSDYQREQQEFQRELEQHEREQQDYIAGQQAAAQEHEARVREFESRMREQGNWQRNLDKNLQNAFGGDRETESSAMKGVIAVFGILALLLILSSPWILLGIYLLLRYKAKARRQQEINNNIDKLLAAGRDIPVELLRGDEPKSDEPVGSRDKGIRNIFLGTGWLIFLTVMVGFDVGSAGFIWIALGISQVIIWYLNQPAQDSAINTQVGQQD